MNNISDIWTNVPRKPGVYFLFSKRKKLVYIGKANDLRSRLVQHRSNFEIFKYNLKKKRLSVGGHSVKPFEFYRFSMCNKNHLLEKELITKLHPKYNSYRIEFWK